MRGGEKKNRHADSSDKQLHRSLFGRQAGMSSGLLVGAHNCMLQGWGWGGGDVQSNNSGEKPSCTELFFGLLGFFFVLLIEAIWRGFPLSSHLVSISNQHTCSLEAF